MKNVFSIKKNKTKTVANAMEIETRLLSYRKTCYILYIDRIRFRHSKTWKEKYVYVDQFIHKFI